MTDTFATTEDVKLPLGILCLENLNQPLKYLNVYAYESGSPVLQFVAIFHPLLYNLEGCHF